MDWIRTPESPNINQFAYDENIQVLKFEYCTGNVYDFYDIPAHIFEAMRNAPSKGEFITQEIKGRYRYARV